MALPRKTAILTFSLPSTLPQESLPLAREREYGVFLRLEGREYSSQPFRPPCNDEEWRDFIKRLRDCNTNRDSNGYRGAVFIRSLARTLYQNLAALHPKLLEFLREAGIPRRLVIQSKRPEIHLLPWGALYDTDGKLLAAGDLSIVQAWEDFCEDADPTAGRLNLRVEFGNGTNQSTTESLRQLPDVIDRDANRDPDIFHLEAHGNAVTKEIGEVGPWNMAQKFGKSKIALLWSCYSAAINSWGESPALCLHRQGSAMVLSFLAELNNLDASSISTFFYRDVFGAAASRDPESALVRIRSTEFETEFDYANWASMTVYLRAPLDLSALALNGPRVPSSSWSQETPEGPLATLVETVGQLQPGSCKAVEMPSAQSTKLPQAIFAGWKGTVVRLDGVAEVFSDETLNQLGLSSKQPTAAHPADRLIWLIQKLWRYGAPLIVWTNASPAHLEFLRIVAPNSPLTFLLLTTQGQPSSIAELVDHNQLAEARAACALPGISGDESFSAAYFAFVRGEDEDKPCFYIKQVQSQSERLLLSGNFVSRFRKKPGDEAAAFSDLELRRLEENYYREALSEAVQARNLRDTGRARQELGYLLVRRGEIVAAENMYRSALDDLERAGPADRDTRWHSALARVLRDWADLLAVCPDRLEEASRLLQRALAIHAFHGRVLQIAYARTTAARIAFTAGRYSEAVESALNAANAFEACGGWRGWGEPMEILLNTFAEMRDPARMKAVTQLAIQKVVSRSNLPQSRRDDLIALFKLKQIQSLWMSGEFDEARSDLKSLPAMADARLQSEADRIRKFLTI